MTLRFKLIPADTFSSIAEIAATLNRIEGVSNVRVALDFGPPPPRPMHGVSGLLLFDVTDDLDDRAAASYEVGVIAGRIGRDAVIV
jgi:hypothetical protein